MTRKELEDLGLTKEQADATIKINGGDIENVRTASASEIKNLQAEITGLQTQVKDRNTQLETLKASTGDAEAMKKQIETLQTDNKTKDDTHGREMNSLKLDFAVEKVLTGSKAKNIKAVMALLDLEDAKFDKDGNVKGLQEQIDKLTTSEDSSFLFDKNGESVVEIAGSKPVDGNGKLPTDNKTESEMSYSDWCNEVENQ